MLWKNVAGQFVNVVMVKASDGSAFTDTVTATLVKDNGTAAAAVGTVTHKGNGQYVFAPTAADTNCDHLGVLFAGTDAVPQGANFYMVGGAQSPLPAALPGAAGGVRDLALWLGTAPLALASQLVQAQANTVGDKTGYGLAAAQAYNNTGQTTAQPADVQQWDSNATAVKVSASTTLPSMDATAISDSQAAADQLEANIPNLDAAITTRQPSGAVDLNADQSGVTIGTVNTTTTNTDMRGTDSASTHTAADVVTALMAELMETGLSFKNAVRVMAAALAGKASGLDANAPVFRNAQADSKNRITATTDANGNRTAVTLDLTD